MHNWICGCVVIYRVPCAMCVLVMCVCVYWGYLCDSYGVCAVVVRVVCHRMHEDPVLCACRSSLCTSMCHVRVCCYV